MNFFILYIFNFFRSQLLIFSSCDLVAIRLVALCLDANPCINKHTMFASRYEI